MSNVLVHDGTRAFSCASPEPCHKERIVADGIRMGLSAEFYRMGYWSARFPVTETRKVDMKTVPFPDSAEMAWGESISFYRSTLESQRSRDDLERCAANDDARGDILFQLPILRADRGRRTIIIII